MSALWRGRSIESHVKSLELSSESFQLEHPVLGFRQLVRDDVSQGLALLGTSGLGAIDQLSDLSNRKTQPLRSLNKLDATNSGWPVDAVPAGRTLGRLQEPRFLVVTKG